MEKFEYCKESYHYELSRRSDLRSALSLPICLTVILAGALYSLLSNYNWPSSLKIVDYSFGLTCLLSGISLGLVIFNLIFCHINYEYAYVPTPKEILDYRDNLVVHYQKTLDENESADQEAERNTVQYLEKEFASNAHHNSLNNNEKSGYLHNASVFLVASLIFTMLAGLLVLISKWTG